MKILKKICVSWLVVVELKRKIKNLSDNLSGVNSSLFFKLSHNSSSWIFTLVDSTLSSDYTNQLEKWRTHRSKKSNIPEAFAKHWEYPTSRQWISAVNWQLLNHQEKKETIEHEFIIIINHLFGWIHEADTDISSVTFRRSFHGRRRWWTTPSGGGGGGWRLTAALEESYAGEFERSRGVISENWNYSWTM